MIIQYLKFHDGRFKININNGRCFFNSWRGYHSATKRVTPIKRYSELLEKKILKPDKCQFLAMLKLQDLYNDIMAYDTAKPSVVKETSRSGEI